MRPQIPRFQKEDMTTPSKYWAVQPMSPRKPTVYFLITESADGTFKATAEKQGIRIKALTEGELEHQIRVVMNKFYGANPKPHVAAQKPRNGGMNHDEKR